MLDQAIALVTRLQEAFRDADSHARRVRIHNVEKRAIKRARRRLTAATRAYLALNR